ncbi:MAG: glycoside hydrolase family 16 protein [Lacibacter sp.]
MKTDLKNLFWAMLCGLFCITTQTVTAQSKYKKLVWSDEFNKPGLPDSEKWGYDTARGCPQNCGWGNNELQYYTYRDKKNARVENGKLIVEARKETKADAKFTSARLVTKSKGDWKFGRIEVKARIPKGRGMWPAIWMLPTNWEYGGWPKSGEIDIMEHVGYWKDSLLEQCIQELITECLVHKRGKEFTVLICIISFMYMQLNGHRNPFRSLLTRTSILNLRTNTQILMHGLSTNLFTCSSMLL